VIGSGASGQNLAAAARFRLSEMLHDQGEDLRAAEVLKPLDEALSKMQPLPEKIAGRTPGSIRSRMDHFYACHWGEKGDRRKQRQYLEAALAADPTDVDVLIACYRFPGADDAWRQKTEDLIKKAADTLRTQIAANPDKSLYYNQLAWLIGNTEVLPEIARAGARRRRLLRHPGPGLLRQGRLRQRRQVPDQGRPARSPLRPDPQAA
jgi:hypothetical protein